MLIRLFETCLQRAEETAAARYGEDHAAQFSKSLVPVFDGHAVTVFEILGNFKKPESSVFRELDGFSDGVDNPPE